MSRRFYTNLIIISCLLPSLKGISQNQPISDLTILKGVNNEKKTNLVLLTDSTSIDRAMFLVRDYEVIPAPQRPFYNHTFKFSTGYSLNTMRLNKSMATYNDTSEHAFNVVSQSPIFSFSYSHAIDNTFKLGYTMAYAHSEIYYDNKPYGSQYFYFSLNPQVHVFRTYRFEYYVKLKIGLEYDHNNRSEVHSQRIQNQYPSGFHMFTGFTFAGINYVISDHVAMNAEFSIWSPETVNVGLSYRLTSKKKPAEDMQFSTY